jgi:hypothetical protein
VWGMCGKGSGEKICIGIKKNETYKIQSSPF